LMKAIEFGLAGGIGIRLFVNGANGVNAGSDDHAGIEGEREGDNEGDAGKAPP
jgi:hypothetical protein